MAWGGGGHGMGRGGQVQAHAGATPNRADEATLTLYSHETLCVAGMERSDRDHMASPDPEHMPSPERDMAFHTLTLTMALNILTLTPIGEGVAAPLQDRAVLGLGLDQRKWDFAAIDVRSADAFAQVYWAWTSSHLHCSHGP